MRSSNRSRIGQEGAALVFVVLAAFAIAGGLALVMQQLASAKISTDFVVNEVVLQEAAKGGLDIGIEQFWNNFFETTGNTTFNLAAYMAYLDGANGVVNSPEVDDGMGNITRTVTVRELITEPRDMARGGVQVTSITVDRLDDPLGTTLSFSSTATIGQATETATWSIRVGGLPFKGFDYAILANNINCILCHAEFSSTDLLYADPSEYGSIDRIKLGSLENLMIRNGSGTWGAETTVAGSLYTRGSVYDHNQVNLPAGGVAGTSLESYEFDGQGHIVQDGSGNMNLQNLSVTDGDDIPGAPNPEDYQFQNFYINYPEDEQYQVDGDLPTSFPAPYPDTGAGANADNRSVDDDEFAPFMDDAVRKPGSLSAFAVVGVPSGNTYGGTAMPSTSSDSGALSGGTYDGNVVLKGTIDNPIVISGDIAINGDLVIEGYVLGTGQLHVRGNTYVVGDLIYKDSAGNFGGYDTDVAGDPGYGTIEPHEENLLAITSGGNIMVGDYNTVRSKPYSHTSSKDGFFNNRFTKDLHINHRVENEIRYDKKGNPLGTGYFDDDVVDTGVPTSHEVTSFTTAEMMLFNKVEHQKVIDDPTYHPRYYRMNPDAPIYEYLGSNQHTDWYDNPNLETIPYDPATMTVLDVSPGAGWISEDVLRQIWFDDQMTRPDEGRPFQVDGLLYSNNAIFAEVHSEKFHGSNTKGQMLFRGGIVSADLGMLIPGSDLAANRDGLKMYYDKRVSNFMTIEDTSRIVLTTMVFSYE